MKNIWTFLDKLHGLKENFDNDKNEIPKDLPKRD